MSSHKNYVFITIATATAALHPGLQHVGIAAGPASLAVLAVGLTMRMLAVRFRRPLKRFTAADTGGAHSPGTRPRA